MPTMTYRLLDASEASQAFARALIVTLIATYIGFLVSLSQVSADIFRTAVAAIIYAPLSIGWYVWTNIDRRAVAQAQWRLFAATCFDVTMVGLALGIAEGTGAPLLLLYLIYIWIILGNGLRFGRPHLDTATALSVLSLLVVAITSPHWSLNAGLTLILVGGMLMVHVFFRQLLLRNEALVATVDELNDDLRRARLDTNELGLAGREAFLEQVQESMSVMPEGSLIAGIVVLFDGAEAHRLSNPQSALSKAMAQRITSELRGSDLATFGEENELWMCMAPRRIEDATAVAERIRRAFDELAPMLEVRVGLAAYPPFPGDATAFFRLAARNARQEGRAASRGINFLRVVDE